MASEKLFTPEDFEKSSKPKKTIRTGLIVVGIVIFIVLIALGVFFLVNKENTPASNRPTEESVQVVENTSSNVILEENTDAVPPGLKTNVNEPELIKSNLSTPAESSETQNSATALPSNIQTASDDVQEEATNVIRGDYGNAPVRYDLLRQKGLDAQAIQRRVNELKREGVF